MKKTFLFLALSFGSLLASQEKPSVADIVSQVTPAVIMVRAEKTSQEHQPGVLIIRKDCRIGAGFIVDEKGYILTASHIIGGYNTIYVELKSGKGYSAQIIKADPKTDVALLKIEAKDLLPKVIMGDGRKVRQGDFCFTIGNPLPQEIGLAPKSFKSSVACGVIGSTERLSRDNKKLFQLSLPVNFGNSGGPLLNDRGEVIGIVSSKMTGFSGQALEGIGFAISVEELRGMLNLLPKRREPVTQISVTGLQKNRESVFLLITELLLILILILMIHQRRERDYSLIKQRLYKVIYLGDYYGYSKILRRIFKNYKNLCGCFPALISDIILLKDKEGWVLSELKRQLEALILRLPTLESQREAMIYRAMAKRALREEAI